MTGGSEPKHYPKKSDPIPTSASIEEIVQAKDATKQKAHKQGRMGNILAGQLNRQVLNFGKKEVGR